MRNKPILIQDYPDPTNADFKITYNYKDLTGQQFGRLTVVCRWAGDLKQFGINDIRPYWVCRCSCGNMCIASGKALRANKIRSCGCYHRDDLGQRRRTHGMSKTRLYHIYRDMIRRCYQPWRKSYKRYGARGIFICGEWYNPPDPDGNGFVSFMTWSMENGYTDELSIDRIDNDGPYAPWNCRWVSMSVQQNNRSSNRHITDADGTVRTYTEFERFYGLYENYVVHYLSRGWTYSGIVYAVHHPELGLTLHDHILYDKDGFVRMIPKIDQKR